MSTCTLRGIPVTFPFEPYSIQKDYMEKVIECLQNDVHGVLESPTGTGKTLSLLCSSLAWLTLKKAQAQALFRGSLDETNEMLRGLNDELKKKVGGGPTNAFYGLPCVIYASRTHSQLSQAMQELKKTAYRHMKAVVLGSRDQLCIHPEVMKESGKNLLCKMKMQSRSCMFYNRLDKKKSDPSMRESPVVDIEDLLAIGKKHRICPYYYSQELQREAEIIFMPYNYILDPRIRKNLNLNLKNCVVILDEAHNIEKICEDSASIQVKSTDLTLAIEEVTEVMKALSETNASFMGFEPGAKDLEPEELCILKEMFLKLEKALDEIQLDSEGSTFEGSYIFEILGKAGINQESFGNVCALCDKIRDFLSMGGNSPFKKRGDGILLVSELLSIAFIKPTETFKTRAKECFKVHISIEEKRKSKDNWLTKLANQKCRVLNYWCFSPAFGMNMLLESGVKSIILTSGTLAPLPPLISELGITIGVRLENPHVVSPSQICVKLLRNGPDDEALDCSYRNRNEPKYKSSLGRSILNLIRLIPDGVLIFFPSYPIMLSCQDHWQQSGIWGDINSIKPIFVEPKDKEAFNCAMNEYYAKIADPSYKGAIFMGVCRGKVSEGLDFADGNGRAVIIVGLPYPPLRDPKVVLKKQYLNFCHSNNKEYLRGEEWYNLEAVRAINQAIGRVIRHQYDYGAILLLDNRFDNFRIKSKLSMWLRDRIEVVKNFGVIVRDTKRFFNNAEAMERPKPQLLETKIESLPKDDCSPSILNEKLPPNIIPSSSSSSNNLVNIHKRNSSGTLENKPKKKRIVLIKEKKSDQEKDKEVSNQDLEYMTLVRNTLSGEECKIFLAGLTEYRNSNNFGKLVACLDKLFLEKYHIRFLLAGLSSYIKAKDKMFFQEYYDQMR